MYSPPPKKKKKAHKQPKYTCPARVLRKQKLSTTKHWEAKIVNKSKSFEADVSFVDIKWIGSLYWDVPFSALLEFNFNPFEIENRSQSSF